MKTELAPVCEAFTFTGHPKVSGVMGKVRTHIMCTRMTASNVFPTLVV